MAVTYPFNYIEKYWNPSKITADQEHTLWVNMQDTINDLVNRCNTKNGTSLTAITLNTSIKKGAALSSADYDSNITLVNDRLNQIIAASSGQGVTPTNTFTLFTRAAKNEPLLIYHRDTNFSTIQVVINTLNNLYQWA